MVIDDEFEYKSYRVHCSAKQVSRGRFAVGLVITRVTPERLLERHFPHVASFASKREAFEHARHVGTAWIDAQEQIQPAPPAPKLTTLSVQVS